MNKTISIVCLLVATLMLVGAISTVIDVQTASAWLWGGYYFGGGDSGAGGTRAGGTFQNQFNGGNNAAAQ